MRVGGFIVSENRAKALTKTTGDNEDSRRQRDTRITELLRQHGAILELVTYPKFSTRDEDVQYLIATAYDHFSVSEFHRLGRDITKLPQFTPGELEERAQTILNDLGIESKFVTCWKHDHLICPTVEALQIRDHRRMTSGKDDAVIPRFLLSY
ncbi:hypothetical protein VKT23_002640 [Stygiomarasmius scandens]|uniref:Uncharacterized protein n=1 Tax=Marasmiellus scandens TaxID=2682957 RepID=A0ABR1K3W4_9AGAR